jgi:hypothetical protein
MNVFWKGEPSGSVVLSDMAKNAILLSEGMIALHPAVRGCEVVEFHLHATSARSMVDQITDAFAKHQWISVDDRLPEVGQPVLVYDEEVRSVLVAELYVGSVTGCLGWTSDALSVASPSHWMPLPEVPRTAT